MEKQWETYFGKTQKLFSERSIIPDEIGFINGLNAKASPALKKAIVKWEEEKNMSVVELLHLPSEDFEQEKIGLMNCIAVGVDQRLKDLASYPDRLTG